MRSIGWNKIYPIFVVAFAIVGAIALYFQSLDTVFSATLIFCAFVFVVLVLFFHTFLFYLALVAFIPFSLDTTFFGEAKMTLPSEGMLLMLIPVLLLFHKNFRKAIGSIIIHPIGMLLVADLVLQMITALTSTHLDVSMKRVVIRLLFILGFFVTINMMENKKQLLRVWLAYCVGFIPVMYFTFRSFQHYEFNPKTVFVISQPYFPDHTLYGACLAFVLPLLVLLVFNYKKLQWQSWQVMGLFGTATFALVSEVLALSRAALLSLVVALIFGVLLHFKVRFRTIMLGLGVVICAAVLLREPIYSYMEKNEAVSNDGEIGNHLSSVTNIQSDASNLERVNRWVCAMRMFQEKPFTGFGPGTYQFEYNQFQTMEHKTYISTNSGDKGNAHSEYLTYLSENGIFGALIFLLTVGSAVYFGMKNHEELNDPLLRIINLGILLGLITYFFHGLFNAFMDQSKMAFLYFTALGTLVWLNLKLKNGKFQVDREEN